MSAGRALQLRQVSLTVSDLASTGAFYRDALGFAAGVEIACSEAVCRLHAEPKSRARAVQLRLGAQRLELLAFEPAGQGYPASSTAADCWFQHIAIATTDMAAAQRALARFAPVPITRGGPQRLPARDGGVTAFKFRDPDGHPLELLHFPPGIGAAEWQNDTGFLGFDHSAISVADVARSIDFYTALLGLAVGSRTVNCGPAQERLDAIAGVRVDVVALLPAGAATPHVELLGYHPPGRTMPRLRSRDLAAARLDFAVDDLDALMARLAAAQVPLVSPGIVALGEGARAALARDPDGHFVVLTEEGR